MNLKSLTDEELKSLHREKTNLKTRAHNLQLGKKIILNSAFGATSNRYFIFFDDDLAESITLSGQLSIRWVERDINQYLNKILKTEDVDYIIAIDTDSLYINFEPLVLKVAPDKSDDEKVEFLDKVCRKLQEVIALSLEKLKDSVNAREQKLSMNREVIADQAIWRAKKKYITRMYMNKGVRFEEPKLKIVGIQAIQSSTPEVCRDKIEEAIELIFDADNDTLIDFIDRFREEFENLPFEDIARPSSVNGLKDYYDPVRLYKSKCPIHVRGSLVYNRFLSESKLDKKFPMIYEGDKIRYCYLKMPNPTRENVISVPVALPRQFGLDGYIDRDTQFQKVFVQPLKGLLDVVHWNTEKKSNLEGWF